MVLYGIPGRDVAAGYSAGGAENSHEYRTWAGEIARALGSAPAIVVVEPDALAQAWSLGSDGAAERLRLLANVVSVFGSYCPNARIYIDASMWVPVGMMATLLRSAEVSRADGFSLNVSNYRSDPEVFSYGNALSRRLDGQHYIVDSSRNGRGVGPNSRAWCNVRGRALGQLPGHVPMGQPAVDGLFWIKHPGVSDGTCNGGPPAGQVWPEVATELVTNAGLS